MKQVIHSVIRYPKGDKTSDEIFEEYSKVFKNEYNDKGHVIKGVSVAINVNEKTVILLVMDEESDSFLRLKFYGLKDVKYTKSIVK